MEIHLSFLDFDYVILSNNNFDERSVKDSVDFLFSLGIRKFIFTLAYDPELHTGAWILGRLNHIKSSFRSLRPYGCQFHLYLDIVYSKELSYTPSAFKRWSIPHTSCVFVRLPLFCEPDQMNAELNHLYFRQKCIPIFTAFEANIHTCSSEWIQQLMRSRNFYCAMDLNFITSLDAEPLIRNAIRNGCRILPSITHSIENYPSILKRMDGFRLGIGDSNYTKFTRSVHILGHQLFPRR